MSPCTSEKIVDDSIVPAPTSSEICIPNSDKLCKMQELQNKLQNILPKGKLEFLLGRYV